MTVAGSFHDPADLTDADDLTAELRDWAHERLRARGIEHAHAGHVNASCAPLSDDQDYVLRACSSGYTPVGRTATIAGTGMSGAARIRVILEFEFEGRLVWDFDAFDARLHRLVEELKRRDGII